MTGTRFLARLDSNWIVMASRAERGSLRFYRLLHL